MRACSRWVVLGVLIGLGSTAAEEPTRIGLDKRIPWTTSKITGSPEPPAPFVTKALFPKQKFGKLVEFERYPNSNRVVVGEVGGKFYTFPTDAKAAEKSLFLDVAALYPKVKVPRTFAITFHPKFDENRYCYVAYAFEADKPNGTHVSRFVVQKTDPPTVDPKSEKVLITWLSGGHNGCCLKFGPDGYLYISAGDGGPAFPPDPLKSGQDLGNVLSTIMRIDVDRPNGDKLYTVPKDNPFVGHEGARPEIWSYGFRNPWRMSFDSNGDLWVGDVGWELWEMIYRVRKGGNYGWSVVEGPQPVHRERPRGPTPILPPTIQHSHIESRSITGGFVYTGKRLPSLVGKYVYGDYVTGKVWAAKFDSNKILSVEEIADTPLAIVSFGLDHDNELVLVDHAGSLHRLIPNPKAGRDTTFPKTLSATGLFASTKDHRIAPGVFPYEINAEPWADHATAERFVGIPNNGKLDVYKKSNAQVGYLKGNWKYPTDSVLVKTISLEMEAGNPKSARRLETQILHFDVDTWRAYTYIWNDEQTDATLADAKGATRTFQVKDATAPGGVRTQDWRFASRSECLLCHSTRGGSVYGFKPDQLDSTVDYVSGKTNQLDKFSKLGLFVEAVPRKKPMPDPHDEGQSLERRARAYLHVNCAHCHQRGGGGTAAMDIQYRHTLEKTNLLDARPTQGAFGLFSAEVLAPSDPYRSVLYYRMAKLGRGRMPHFGSEIVDVKGLRLIHDWIRTLPKKADPAEEPVRAIRKQQLELVKGLSDPKSIDELLSSTSGALVLLHSLDSNQLDEPTRKLVIAKGSTNSEAVVRDLFERFIPVKDRTKKLGTVVDVNALLSVEGDVVRGRKLFTEAKSIQCRNCHTLDGKGHELGPDLGKIGKKYGRAKILEQILEPSKEIDPKYVPYLLETKDGMVRTGLLVSKTEKVILLKDAERKEIRVAPSEVELLTPLQRSIMPELLLRDMTREEVADLLAFLESLR